MINIGLILSAGKQTRFKENFPKSLININNDMTLLDYNIITMKKYCNIIYITIQKECYHKNLYIRICEKYEFVKIIEISSGLGCGDAVLKSLLKIEYNKKDKIFLIWGDSIQINNKLYKKCIKNCNKNRIIIPAKLVKNPYVGFKINNKKQIESVHFSKYGDKLEKGYHDYSLFYFDPDYLLCLLLDVKKRNEELLFLDIFNNNKNINSKLIKCNYDDNNSFNTVEEFLNIKKLLTN